MDIQHIFQQAKEHMLHDGNHVPMLLVQLAEGGQVVMVFADFPYETTVEKQEALFGLGLKLGQDHRSDEICQICFVVEVWMSQPNPGKTYRAPSEDPERREAISAQVLSVLDKTVKQEMFAAEIIRAGDCIDLAPYETIGEVENRLLPAFLAGFVGAKLSPIELSRILRKYV